MGLESNQFGLKAVKGQLTLAQNFNTFSCVVDADEANPLVVGQAVKIKDVAGDVITVTKAVASDKIFGFIPHNVKKESYLASEMVKVASRDCIMIMEAGGAILSGASLEVVVTGEKVITNAGVNKIVGESLQKASADGDLIKVWISAPLVAQI